MSRKGWFFGILAVLVVAGLVGWGVYKIAPTSYQTAPRIAAIPPAAQASVPSAAQPSGVPAPPPVSHDAVAQAMPTYLTIGKVGELPLLNRVPIDTVPATLQVGGPYDGSVMPSRTDIPAVQN